MTLKTAFSIDSRCGTLLAPKPKTYPLNDIRELALGCYDNGEPHEPDEGMITLYFYELNRWHGGRRMFAYWLAADIKLELFEMISDYVNEKKIPLKITQYGGPKERFSFSLRRWLGN